MDGVKKFVNENSTKWTKENIILLKEDFEIYFRNYTVKLQKNRTKTNFGHFRDSILEVLVNKVNVIFEDFRIIEIIFNLLHQVMLLFDQKLEYDFSNCFQTLFYSTVIIVCKFEYPHLVSYFRKKAVIDKELDLSFLCDVEYTILQNKSYMLPRMTSTDLVNEICSLINCDLEFIKPQFIVFYQFCLSRLEIYFDFDLFTVCLACLWEVLQINLLQNEEINLKELFEQFGISVQQIELCKIKIYNELNSENLQDEKTQYESIPSCESQNNYNSSNSPSNFLDQAENELTKNLYSDFTSKISKNLSAKKHNEDDINGN